MAKLSPAIILGIASTSLACENPRLDEAAQALEDSAIACELAARNERTKFDDTPACNALSALSMRYLEAEHGGGSSMENRLHFANAQQKAWGGPRPFRVLYRKNPADLVMTPRGDFRSTAIIGSLPLTARSTKSRGEGR